VSLGRPPWSLKVTFQFFAKDHLAPSRWDQPSKPKSGLEGVACGDQQWNGPQRHNAGLSALLPRPRWPGRGTQGGGVACLSLSLLHGSFEKIFNNRSNVLLKKGWWITTMPIRDLVDTYLRGDGKTLLTSGRTATRPFFATANIRMVGLTRLRWLSVHTASLSVRFRCIAQIRLSVWLFAIFFTLFFTYIRFQVTVMNWRAKEQ